MNPDLQRKLAVYRERKAFAVHRTALPSITVLRILPDDPALVPMAAMRLAGRNDAPVLASLPIRSSHDERDAWLQQVLRLTPITDHFFLGLNYAHIGWLEVTASDPRWIGEVARSASSVWFWAVDSARTHLVFFSQVEYQYDMIMLPLTDPDPK